jgi:flagellar motor switch/type III secretory pathway protein FliN
MSNRQADALHIEVLGGTCAERTCLTLKPTHLLTRQFKKLTVGSLIEGWDPLHLRIMREGNTIARAKLGRIAEHEAIHIVATQEPQSPPTNLPKKHRLLEGRLRLLSEETFEVGDVLEYTIPLSKHIVLVADSTAFGLGEMVEYDGDIAVRITRMLDV